MRCLDLSFAEPEKNLACDEVLLDDAEAGQGGETLRFWESPVHFVVLGTSQCLKDEAREEACARDAIPILRRCSAGGCVLQGPGCLNYTLVLDQEKSPPLRSIGSSYRYIFERIVGSAKTLGLDLRHEGTSDLVHADRKVSGNAQRRKRRFILHHGTLLFNMDLDLIQQYIVEPSERPAYRGARPHAAFVGNVPASSTALKDMLRQAFGAVLPIDSLSEEECARVDLLAEARYASASWTYRR
ncbi:MAG: lipoate--protein ligase family protein [Candidatus Hydrogenedentes bacterium]|nr:lipoate--protein ligase family protein [Candidatus Hydrogenedentota bacterium]